MMATRRGPAPKPHDSTRSLPRSRLVEPTSFGGFPVDVGPSAKDVERILLAGQPGDHAGLDAGIVADRERMPLRPARKPRAGIG